MSSSLFFFIRNHLKFFACFFKLGKLLILFTALSSCSILVSRPVQDMSDTAAAMRAAREVNAETLSPNLYRQADEAFLKAKSEYRLKNFNLAKKYALKARVLAEQAEFESLQSGATRSSTTPPEPPTPQPGPAYEYPTPTGIPAANYNTSTESSPAPTDNSAPNPGPTTPPR